MDDLDWLAKALGTSGAWNSAICDCSSVVFYVA